MLSVLNKSALWFLEDLLLIIQPCFADKKSMTISNFNHVCAFISTNGVYAHRLLQFQPASLRASGELSVYFKIAMFKVSINQLR